MREEVWLLVFTVIIAIVLLILMPIATIWSLNIVFGLEIAYTFKTWLAIAWLITVIYGIKRFNNDS